MDDPELDEVGKPLLRRTTPIHHAAKHKYSDDLYGIIDELFEMYNSYDVNYTDESGYSHFHVACRFGFDEVVEKFFELGQDPNCLVTETGDSPLHLALANGHKEVAERLLKNGANPNLANKDGLLPLHILCTKCTNSDLIKMFLNKLQQNPNHIVPKTGDSPLHLALEFGRKKVAKLLLRNGANPNLANKDGLLPLHILCTTKYPNSELMEIFLNKLQQNPNHIVPKTGDSPLHLAVENGHKEVAKLLLRNGANPNWANKDGLLPLHILCTTKYPNSELMEIFLNKLQQNPNHIVPKTGDSPLHLALENGHKEMAELLLRNGANPNLANGYGLTPLHILNMRHNTSDLVKMFFDVNDELNQTLRVDALNDLGDAPLHLALLHGKLMMIQLLLEHDADPNLANAEGSTPLHLISLVDEGDRMAELLFRINKRKYRQGKTSLVRVDFQNEWNGITPLHYALQRGKKNIARLLLRNGANSNLESGKGLTPLRIIINFHEGYSEELANVLLETSKEVNRPVQVDEPDRSGNTPLYYALQRGNEHMIKWLVKNGAGPVHGDKPDQLGNTPLHHALQRGNVGTTKMLLKHGADPNSANKKGLTPLHMIINHHKRNSDYLAKILLETCKEFNRLVDKPDNSGNTPLHHALQRGNICMIKWLLKNGADPNLANKKGLTPLHIIIDCHKHHSDYWAKILLETSGRWVQVDKPDHSGNTPLMLAVGKLLPRLVDVLLDHGADFSRSIVPSEIMPEYHECKRNLKLILVSGIIAVMERFQSRGIKIHESSFLTFYITAILKYGPRETPANIQESWYDDKKFAIEAKKITMKPNLSLYDLIRLPSDEAQRQLKSTDYLEFARSKYWSKFPKSHWEICAEHLCEKIPRARYFLDWQADFMDWQADFN
ncbi:unnamed protein product [Trichogramma brassicae]|uniref:Uncharacterized protein n=1 Tax=Trichogramma brassicae TaxID=86971 RepID=A0A6H5IK59_9HYME|nr:unnamed protein product [Trichogramma brassicae]